MRRRLEREAATEHHGHFHQRGGIGEEVWRCRMADEVLEVRGARCRILRIPAWGVGRDRA